VGVGDDLYLLARGNDGMRTLRYSPDRGAWEELAVNDPDWSDANGWADRANYGTIQAIAVDGRLFLLSRADSGLRTLRYDPASDAWEEIAAGTSDWSDAEGWTDPENYGSIHAVAVGTDLFLLAQADDGLSTLRYDRRSDTWIHVGPGG
ncbi:hypothetical protein, partial [Rubellimicrobium arenae]